MRLAACLSLLLLPACLTAQSPSLGDRLKAERPAIEQLMAQLDYPEAQKRSEALLPATTPALDKKDNNTLIQGCTLYLDLASTNRLAAETADSAGA